MDEELELLIGLLRARREKLAQFVDVERERKRSILKEQIGRCASHLNKTTALVQFCIELLKEPDPVSYLQVSDYNKLNIILDWKYDCKSRNKSRIFMASRNANKSGN